MRVNTRIIIDISTNEVVSRDAFEYNGALSLASGGGATKTESSPDPQTMATEKLQRESVLEPLISSFMPKWITSLASGGVDETSLPMVQSGVNDVRSGTSSALSGIKAALARIGATGTPYAAKQIADTTSQGEVAASSVGPSMAMELFRQVPGMVTGTASNIINTGKGLGSSTSNIAGNPAMAAAQGVGAASSLASLAYLGYTAWLAY